jgi:phosphoglycolate phosphatase-like HAD superfamily hydrolase
VADHAIIFDVDGVLLELTRPEEELFFEALSKFVPTHNLSRDWNSYAIRNDEDIIVEILRRNALSPTLLPDVKVHYMSVLQSAPVGAQPIAGAALLLNALRGQAKLGIATANLLAAARHRLQQAEMWAPVSDLAYGADGGGHKSAILGRALSKLNMDPRHIIYIGDNLNDVDAGLQHGVHFIGFSESADKRKQLQNAGAEYISANHSETLNLINRLLA